MYREVVTAPELVRSSVVLGVSQVAVSPLGRGIGRLCSLDR